MLLAIVQHEKLLYQKILIRPILPNLLNPHLKKTTSKIKVDEYVVL